MDGVMWYVGVLEHARQHLTQHAALVVGMATLRGRHLGASLGDTGPALLQQPVKSISVLGLSAWPAGSSGRHSLGGGPHGDVQAHESQKHEDVQERQLRGRRTADECAARR